MASKAFMSAVAARRTFYQLSKSSPISDPAIESLVKEAIKNVPSSFNAQSARLVLLLNKDHDKFWDMTKEALKAIVPAANFPATEQRINGFAGAYGSILFYEDQNVISGLQKNMPTYADKFPQWSEHTSAMHQFVLWTALETEGLGCNLQHYNPLVDKKAAAEWGLPESWELKAQLVFGKPEGQPSAKEFQPIESRFKVFGTK